MTPLTDRYLSWRTTIEAGVAGLITTALTLLVFGPIWSAMTGPLGGGDMLATYVNATTGAAGTTHPPRSTASRSVWT